ncbi:hypothetical protein BGZ80_001951 [Entomortierella chlamydospora]|uniref:Tag1-like fifth Ig-like domain-containing protein n=1 Tax=Entomortierella chlamydospora TaxID=101097 RepID=A0A9P6SXL8_9FUNG|nr:hypothetical protein BGZ79_001784 [Entomortierella chlamydospora]KAG0009900.1 hypothetical protein BGZ80_001951 [Entomortierella chlamydospora]
MSSLYSNGQGSRIVKNQDNNHNNGEDDYTTNEQTPLLSHNPDERVQPATEDNVDIERGHGITSPLPATPSPPLIADRLHRWNKTYTRAFKIIGLILLTILIIIAVPPLIAQRVVDRAMVLDIHSADIRDMDQTGFQISIQSTICLDSSKDGFLGLTGVIQRLFEPTVTIEPTTLSLSLPSLEYGVNMAEFEVDKQQMQMGQTLQLNISTHARVTNAKLMAEFFSQTLQQSTVDLAIRGPILTRIGSLWHMKLRINRSVPMDGLQGLQNATLVSMELPNDHPLGGVTMSGVARINNPSKVVSLQMGVVTLGIYLPSMAHPDVDFYKVAEVESPGLRLEAGKSNDLAISGRLFHLDDWSISERGIPTVSVGSEKQLILGRLLSQFIQGNDSKIQIRAISKDHDIPPWLSEAYKSIVLEMVFPGSPTNDFIKSLDMSRLHFGFSDDNSSALLSGQLSSVLQLPPNVTFPIKVLKMKPLAWLKPPGGKNMASLGIPDFLATVSRQVGTTLEVHVEMEDSPLIVVEDQLPEFYQFLNSTFNKDWIHLGIVGDALAVVECGLGTFEIGPIGFDVVTSQRGIGGLSSVTPILDGLDVIDSTEHSLTVKATLIVWNPSSITANLGGLSFLWSYDGRLIGMASVPDLKLKVGNNTIECFGMMDPRIDCTHKNDPSCDIGFAGNASREFISKYISGDNTTTIDILGYAGSTKIPLLQPMMSSFFITSSLPEIEQDFLISSTMYLLSHTLVLELRNPLDTPITVLYINGTASYKNEPLGHILVDFQNDIASPKPILIPANDHQNETSGYAKTPKLPVTFDLSSVGYEALKKALGGTLEVDVLCHIKTKVGSMLMWVDFAKDGVSSDVRKGF